MTVSEENAATLSLSARFLGGLVTAVSARPRFTLWCVLSLACAAVGITVAHLTVRTSRADLLNPAAEFAKSWKTYAETFGATSDLIVVVESKTTNPQLLQSVLNDLGQRVERESELFSKVLYRIDQQSLRSKALQFLSPSQLQRTASRVERYSPVIRNQQWDRLRTENLVAQLRTGILKAEKTGATAESLYAHADRFAESLLRFQQQAQNGSNFEAASFYSPLSELLKTQADAGTTDSDVAYLMNAEKTVGLLQVFPVSQPDEIDENSRSIRKLRELMNVVAAEYRPLSEELSLSLTGVPVLEHDEMHRSAADMLNAGMIAFALVSVVLFLGFRSMRHPMLAIMTLVVSICWTFGAATLVIGHLNILSVSFAVILIGLGIDFSIHFLSRYLSLRHELYDLGDALRKTAHTAGTGILMSAMTTALAFGSAMLTGVPGLAELGLISGMGILICAAATFVFLPALIALSDAELDVESLPHPFTSPLYRRLITTWPVVVVAFSVIGIGAIASRAFSYTDGSVTCRARYDSNLMKLHDQSLESVRAESRLFEQTSESLLYAVAVADSWEDAIRLRNEFQKLPTVGRVSEMASRLPPPPTSEQRQLIQELRNQIYSMPKSRPQFQPVSLSLVGREIESLYRILNSSPSVTARNAAGKLNAFLDELESMSKGTGDKAVALMEAYQMMVARSLLQELDRVAIASKMEPVRPSDLPPELQARYVVAKGDQQAWLVKVYPRQPVWDAKPLAAFVRDVRSVAPDISGVPIQNYESAGLLHVSYKTVGLYSLAVISFFLLFDFLRPGQKLLTVIPPVAVAAFVGYSMHQRTGNVNLNMLVMIAMGLMVLIASVLDYRNLRDSVLAMFPSIGGVILLLGVMVITGLNFNPVNLIVLPLILGIGVDNGIHLLQDFRRQIASGADSYAPSPDTTNGVLMTSLTSIVGFGSMMVSAHQGLFTIGILLAIGIAGSLLIALIPLPALLTLVGRHQPASMEPVRLRPGKSEVSESTTQSSPTKQQPQKSKKAA